MNIENIIDSIPRYDARTTLEDAFAIRFGAPNINNAKARHLALADSSTRELFKHFEKRNIIVAHEFNKLIGEAICKIPAPNLIPKHRQLSKFIQAANFHNNAIIMQADNMLSTIVPKGGMVTYSPSQQASVVYSQIAAHKIPVFVTREAIINGETSAVELITPMFNEAYRDEAECTYAALESNLSLGDGSPLFYGDNTASASGNYADIGAALALFRSQKLSNGRYTNLEPKYFIVPPAAEVAASKEIKQAGLETIEVFSTPHVTKSYLLADPTDTTVLVRHALTDKPQMQSYKPGEKLDIDGFFLELTNDFEMVAVSRIGAVRLT